MLDLTHPVVDIAIVCSNFEKSLHFYRDCLGLEVVLDIQIPAAVATGIGLAPTGFRQVRLQSGSTLIKLMEIADPPPTRSADFGAGVRWLTFFVKDVAAEVQRLTEKGVEFVSEPISAPDTPGVVCALDPDGVLIELVQRETGAVSQK